MIEVEFVEHDDAGLLLLEDQIGDGAILCLRAVGAVHDEEADVRTTQTVNRATGTVGFDFIQNLGFATESGGINQDVRPAADLAGDVNGIARGACNIADNGALLAEDGVDQ